MYVHVGILTKKYKSENIGVNVLLRVRKAFMRSRPNDMMTEHLILNNKC